MMEKQRGERSGAELHLTGVCSKAGAPGTEPARLYGTHCSYPATGGAGSSCNRVSMLWAMGRELKPERKTAKMHFSERLTNLIVPAHTCKDFTFKLGGSGSGWFIYILIKVIPISLQLLLSASPFLVIWWFLFVDCIRTEVLCRHVMITIRILD